MNPRAKIHDLWGAFWPSLFFAWAYAAALTYILNRTLLTTVKALVANLTHSFEQWPITTELRDLELLKLIPIAVVFAAALALYLFDRIVTAVSSILPPYHYWKGNLLLYLGQQRLTRLWSLCPRITEVTGLSEEVDRLVELAYTENRVRLTNSLDWANQKLGYAARLLAYAKTFLYWIPISALAARQRFHLFLISQRVLGMMAVGLLGYLAALLYQTHHLLAATGERLRIAETMRDLQGAAFGFSEQRSELLAKQYERSVSYGPTTIIGLRWVTTDPFTRLFWAMWSRRRPRLPSPPH